MTEDVEQQALPIVDPEIEEELDEPVPLKYEITAYGADYPVDGLVQRINSGDIVVPDFQRGFIWKPRQCHRFIESLLLGLPVPGIFLSKEPETGALLVLDGQQRLRTLQAFYVGELRGEEFALQGVSKEFEGKTYSLLDEEDRRRLDNSIIHATVVRQDVPSEDESSIYFIFERLNTGGTELTPQEIRASIYQGEFDELLRKLSLTQEWKVIYPRARRLKDQELILRFFAFLYQGEEFVRPMADFLNAYMAKNRHLQHQSAEELTAAFDSAVTVVAEALGSSAFRPSRLINAAVFDSVMVGLAERLRKGPISNLDDFKEAYERLLSNNDYVLASMTGATSNEDNVKRRLRLAREAFADLG